MRVTLPLLSLLAAPLALAQPGTTLIPLTSFDSQEEFDKYWDYLYPWGSDHNGSARMRESQVRMENGTITLTAKRVNGEPQATHGGKKLNIRYLSGAIHARQHFTVAAGGGIDYYAELKVKTYRGSWPAYWATYTEGWPPEIDIAEWYVLSLIAKSISVKMINKILVDSKQERIGNEYFSWENQF